MKIALDCSVKHHLAALDPLPPYLIDLGAGLAEGLHHLLEHGLLGGGLLVGGELVGVVCGI